MKLRLSPHLSPLTSGGHYLLHQTQSCGRVSVLRREHCSLMPRPCVLLCCYGSGLLQCHPTVEGLTTMPGPFPLDRGSEATEESPTWLCYKSHEACQMQSVSNCKGTQGEFYLQRTLGRWKILRPQKSFWLQLTLPDLSANLPSLDWSVVLRPPPMTGCHLQAAGPGNVGAGARGLNCQVQT